MIQRIQSLYLLIVVILTGILFLTPVLEFSVAGEPFFYDLNLWGLTARDSSEVLLSSSPLIMLVGLTGLVALLTIFFFKNRMLQVRFSIFNIICLIGYAPLLWYFIHRVQVAYNADLVFKVVAAIPLINAVFSYMALKAIGKDEALVRSVDRIR